MLTEMSSLGTLETIAVIGLGYVGLPLAAEFGKHRRVVGFDSNAERIAQLKIGSDLTLECSARQLSDARYLTYTNQVVDIANCQIYIVAVPTPINQVKQPDLSPLVEATETVGRVLKQGDIVIYESTVYPGATEEICVPILERVSGLKFNQGFGCGYSPERVNPGDKVHRLPAIKKITSGSTPKIADAVDRLYKQIITAGTHKASSLKVAEAAKVIENTQRDVNIALMNEISVICHRLSIDTLEVIEAASTKWNFLPFRPGLVGGHCIGVDPYYLTHKAQEVGYHPEVILAGRRINDGMAKLVAERTVKLMLEKGLPVLDGRVLVLGLTFKENCSDLRNSKVLDMIRSLREYKLEVDTFDPWVPVNGVPKEYEVTALSRTPVAHKYEAVILAVAHDEFVVMGEEKIRSFAKTRGVFFDVKGVFPADVSDGRL